MPLKNEIITVNAIPQNPKACTNQNPAFLFSCTLVRTPKSYPNLLLSPPIYTHKKIVSIVSLLYHFKTPHFLSLKTTFFSCGQWRLCLITLKQ